MSLTKSNGGEALQEQLREYLARNDRAGDHERIAQRLAEKHSTGSHVVGFRRNAREVLLHKPRTDDVANVLAIHEIGRAGHLPRIGTVWKGRDLELWIERHWHYLDWVRPDLANDIG